MPRVHRHDAELRALSDAALKERANALRRLLRRDGFRPDLGFPGYWLYAGDVPCIHIAASRSS